MSVSPRLEAIQGQIKTILVQILNLPLAPEAIGDEDVLFDPQLGVDSVVAIDLLVSVEEAFGIELPDDEISERAFESVRALALVVERHLGEGEA